jgi:hypothetical protein
LPGLASDAAAIVDHAIDGRRTETSLKGDILDQKVMRHCRKFASILMDF